MRSDVSALLIEAVRRTIAEKDMICPGETVLVGLSGGADSVALLHALWTLRAELSIDLVAAHLNHGIRGADADEDAEFVRVLASKLDIAVIVETVSVPAIQVTLGVGMEEAARTARYDFLERTAEAHNAARIAVAHTSDDQAETVLLNIIRGSGIDGLAGMPAVRGKIIRPLNDVSRAEVEDYLRENVLQWRTDPTNFEDAYTRNRVRLRLIPFLQEEFNPRVKEALLSLSKLAADESELLGELAGIGYSRAVLGQGSDWIELDACVVRAEPAAIRRRVVRKAIEHVKGDLRDVEFHQVQRLLSHLAAEDSITLTLPTGVIYARITPARLRVFRAVEPEEFTFVRPLVVPGVLELPELGITIETRPVPTETRPSGRFQAVVDMARIKGGLAVRTWRPGDRIVPFGMTGHKKLQDVFTDAHIPRQARGTVPVIVDDEKVIWLGGIVTSQLVKVTKYTRSATLIELKGVQAD